MKTFERTFDNAVIDYDKTRPDYIKELYDDILQYKEIDARNRVLEIGIGTGKATGPILEKQCCVVGIEPGKQLADFTREKFRGYSNFFLYNQTLQDYECPAGTYDLIYAATAFHWIPEEYGYRRVHELLKKGGAFARFAYHAGKDKKREGLALELKGLYEKHMHATSEPKEYDENDAEKLAQIAGNYGFSDIKYKLYHWTKDFTAEEYMGLLKTYPDHMALEEPVRESFFHEIRNAIDRHGGVITVHYTMDLQLARKRQMGF